MRIAQFDIDVALPAGATVRESYSRADIFWPCCAVEIALTYRSVIPQRKDDARAARPLGTFELTCGPTPFVRGGMDPRIPPDPSCLSLCDHMTPLPGSRAEERELTDPPVIQIERRGGLAYREESTLVWSDGTVQYYGSHCRTLRGPRATLAPERVAALLAAIERGGSLTIIATT